MGERSARRLCAEDVALLMRKALSPASKRTHVLNSAVSVADSFAQCFVAPDSLDSGGSVMLEELVGARMCPLSRDNFVVPRIYFASGTFIWKWMVELCGYRAPCSTIGQDVRRAAASQVVQRRAKSSHDEREESCWYVCVVTQD